MPYRPKVLGYTVGWCTVDGKWTKRVTPLTFRIKGQSAGGRPSAGSYSSNPKVEVILPKPGSITYVPLTSRFTSRPNPQDPITLARAAWTPHQLDHL
jgi:hypothetical protein